AGLGFSPFHAATICLLANTAPVAFGSIGIPLVTLNATTGLPLIDLSANTGRIVAPLSTMIPAYLILVTGGIKELRRVGLAAIACGVTFGLAQILVSNLSGPYLTDILASLASILAIVVLLKFWKPSPEAQAVDLKPKHYSVTQLLLAWSP